MKFRKKVQMFRDFGFLVGFSSACSSALRYPMALTRWKDRCILDWLRKKYSTVIKNHKQKIFTIEEKSDTPAIWSVWWQGEENAPELVRMCFAAIRKHQCAHPFRIITEANYRDYIDLPEHIIRKVQEGT